MTPAGRTEWTSNELDDIACGFLGSEFTAQTYSIWPIDRRVDAYLRHHGLDGLVNHGGVYQDLIERVMANIGRALRRDHLASPES
jgi:hypothetical protein